MAPASKNLATTSYADLEGASSKARPKKCLAPPHKNVVTISLADPDVIDKENEIIQMENEILSATTVAEGLELDEEIIEGTHTDSTMQALILVLTPQRCQYWIVK